MKSLPAQTKVILDADHLRRSLTRISFEIIEQNKELDQVVLVGIKTRGISLAQRIAQRIEQLEGIKCEVDEIDISYYRDDQKVDKTQLPKLSIDIQDKTVILVDDVLYTGRTIRAALVCLLNIARPQKIKLATLIDRGHRELPIRPDYVGKNIPTSKNESIKVHLVENDGEDGVYLINE